MRSGVNIIDQQLEKACTSVYEKILNLVDGKIPNANLALADAKSYPSQYEEVNRRLDGWRPYAAKHWLWIFSTLLVLTVNESTCNQDRSKCVLIDFLLSFWLLIIMKAYEVYLGDLPLANLGRQLFLNKKDRELGNQYAAFNIVNNQYQYAAPSPKSALSFFRNNPLYRRNYLTKGIHPSDREAILKGLFGIKNRAIDCVGASGLVVLGFLETQIPVSIYRIFTAYPSIYAHSFVVVNLQIEAKQFRDFSAWNEDAWIIDAWYKICMPVKAIRQNDDFFDRYPLLQLKNKSYTEQIYGDKPTEPYQFALKKFIAYCEQEERGIEDKPGCFSTFCPKL